MLCLEEELCARYRSFWSKGLPIEARPQIGDMGTRPAATDSRVTAGRLTDQFPPVSHPKFPVRID